jgi:hypothetical protein
VDAQRLKVGYRDPYTALHSSVSWDLMIGKNLLWAAKQHSHSVSTALSTYTAWTEGAKESDIEAVKRAMQSPASPAQIVLNAPLVCPQVSPEFGTALALEEFRRRVNRGFRREIYGGKGGTRTLDPGIMSAVA